MNLPLILEASSRVSNGMPLLKHEMPWLVPIFDSSKTESRCTGSIIGKYHVLTSAHCNYLDWVATEGAHKTSEIESFNEIVKFQYLWGEEAYDIKSAPDREEHKMYWARCKNLKPSDCCIDIIDIAVITLKDEIQFKPGLVEKAKLAPLSNIGCPHCRPDCSFFFTVACWDTDPADPGNSLFSSIQLF